ncbi:MAG: LysR family transcriptional regulator [Rhodospirillales bacterium]
MIGAMASAQEIPDLSVKHLRAVVALARFGSFVAAASYLGISQPGLTRIIQQAERRLGVRPFARGTRSVSQTEAGREFIPAAERLLGELSQQTQKARTLDGEMRGQLIIACLMSISHRVLPAALVDFRKQHPKMHIHVREGLASSIQEDVRSGLADLGIGNAVGVHGSITVESIADEPCYVVIPSRHRLRAQSVVGLKDLAEEPMVSMPTDSGLRRTIDVAAHAQGVVLNHSIVTNQFGSLFDFVANGLGISIVPATALPPANEYPIVTRPLRPAMTRRIGILRLAERSLSPAAEAFLKVFRPKFFSASRRPQHKTARG